MMLAWMIAYQVFACCVVAAVGYFAFQRTKRDLRAAADRAIAELNTLAYTPPMPEPPPVPESPPDEDDEPPAPTSAVLLRIQCDDEDLGDVIDYLADRGFHPAVVERQAS